MKAIFAVCLLTLLGLTGCTQDNEATPTFGKVVEVPAEGPIPERQWLTQNWDAPTRKQFWYTNQGSRFLPYVWFTWLEQADNQTLFRHATHMTRFGYLPENSFALNPAGLPIGFALDKDKHNGDAWLGFTCAACHTGQVSISGAPILIEGGSALSDFMSFFDALRSALKNTQNQPEKFTRFAKRVLADDYSATLANQLKQDLGTVIVALDQHHDINRAHDSRRRNLAGHGRIDAFGIIQNAGTALSMGDLSNHNSSNAPVSYPFLWGTNQSDVVQWNGLLPNTSVVGPLARNAGEVVGTFGGLTITPAPWWKRWFLGQKNTYRGSVNFANLGDLETWARDLRSPQWHESPLLPPIDATLAAAGEKLYIQNCQHCHALIPRENQHLPYNAVMVRTSIVGTDPTMAHNAIDHIARTLRIEGVKKAIYFGDKFGSSAPAIEFAINGTFGLMLANPVAAYKAAKRSARAEANGDLLSENGNGGETLKDQLYNYIQALDATTCDTPQSLLALTTANIAITDDNDNRYCYKARPLTGIWTSAPFLHNGSVPSLWDLLQTPENRPREFWVGSTELDTTKVGLETTKGASLFQVYQDDGITYEANNANSGHLFGTQLSDEEKWQLVEFLKTL